MRLEGTKLGFRYSRRSWLFRRVHVAIHSGEVVGLVGPSGCGKTTLGRILAGFDRPIEGDVTIDGQALPQRGYHPVQMVFQHPERAVNPRWRLYRTIAEGGELKSEWLEKFGIQERWLHRWPNELSGGELQRICIARALGRQPKFLIADEMTAMLDAITQAQLFHALLEIVEEQQLGVLVISHDTHLVKRVCNRIILWENFIQ